MKRQSIKKYQQKELNLVCKTDVKEYKKSNFCLSRATKAKGIEYAKLKWVS